MGIFKIIPFLSPHFPRTVGYSGSGIIYRAVSKVTQVKVGDRVAAFGGKHKSFAVYNESNVIKLDDEISFSEASMTYRGLCHSLSQPLY